MTAARERLDLDSAAGSIMIWDPVVRAFHWGLAAAVFIALMSDEDRALHEGAGYAALALLLVRILWGFLGALATPAFRASCAHPARSWPISRTSQGSAPGAISAIIPPGAR